MEHSEKRLKFQINTHKRKTLLENEEYKTKNEVRTFEQAKQNKENSEIKYYNFQSTVVQFEMIKNIFNL